MDYAQFLIWLYGQHPKLTKASAREQASARRESLFGGPRNYSRYLEKLGAETLDIYANNAWMQQAWLKQHRPDSTLERRGRVITRVAFDQSSRRASVVGRKLGRRILGIKAWVQRVLIEQIEHFRPTVIIDQAMDSLDGRFVARELRSRTDLLIGWHSATDLDPIRDYSAYDGIVSSFAPTLDFFRERGVRTEKIALAFEPQILDTVVSPERDLPLTFIGSFAPVHRPRTLLLESVARHFPELKVWGPDLSSIPVDSVLRDCYQGPAWGREMYKVLVRSRVTLNHHGDVQMYANNFRLFEATGCGAALVTDERKGLSDLFDVGAEVASYTTEKELLSLVEVLTRDRERAQSMGGKGQQRTLSEHTYESRSVQLMSLIDDLRKGS